MAVPVEVHRVNWMWANPEVFKKAGASVPQTWDEFVVAADKIEKAGFIAVAHGSQPWQDFTVFESVALGVGGAEFYRKAMVELDQASLKSPTMKRSSPPWPACANYIDKGIRPTATGTRQPRMVISSKGRHAVHGRLGQGVSSAPPAGAGQRTTCVPAPGTARLHLQHRQPGVLRELLEAGRQGTQRDLAEAVMSPAFREGFNLARDSIPPRLGMDRASSMTAPSAPRRTSRTVPSPPAWCQHRHQMAVTAATAGAMQDVVTEFFNSSA